MRNLTKFLSVLAVLAAPSVASANEYNLPISDASYDACWAKGELHMSLARSAGYELADDLAGIFVETFGRCLADAGLKPSVARAEASYFYCDIVADLKANVSDPNGHGAYDLCEDSLSERLAERAP